MARIEPIERRQIEAIAAEIEEQLGAAVDTPGISTLTVPLSTPVNVDRWRRAVRLVGRRHGWKVRTGVGKGVAWATDLREPPEDLRKALAERAVDRLDGIMREASKPKLRPI